MAEQRTAYVNARLLDPASGLDSAGALLTVGGVIADLGASLFPGGVPDGIDVVDCGGHLLAPGLIDMHAHLCEPGAEHMETMATAGRAAAAGGITTMVAMPDTLPVIDEVALIEFVSRRARETCCVNVLPTAAVTRGLNGTETTEFGMLAEAGAVAFCDPGRSIAGAQVMRRALSYASAFDLLIIHHVEDTSLAESGCMNEGEWSMRLGLTGIPAAAETIVLSRDIQLVELTGGRYHAAHISLSESLDAVRAAKQRGLDVSCGVAPYNFALNEVAIGEYRTFAKTKPPLRDEAERIAMVEGLADGSIDVISSAHCPQDQESKRLPFAQAAFGIIGLETMLPLGLELYHTGQIELAQLMAAMTCRPAELLGLKSGRLAEGAPADLTLIDLDRPWVVDARRFQSKSKNSPFDGRPVQGHAIRTVVAGETVFTRGG